VVGRAGGGLFGHVVAEPQHQLLLSLPPSSLYFLVLILFVSFCDFFSYFDIKKNREMNPAKTSFQDLTFFNRVSPFDALCALV
jgi:hypothetical protein